MVTGLRRCDMKVLSSAVGGEAFPSEVGGEGGGGSGGGGATTRGTVVSSTISGGVTAVTASPRAVESSASGSAKTRVATAMTAALIAWALTSLPVGVSSSTVTRATTLTLPDVVVSARVHAGGEQKMRFDKRSASSLRHSSV